MHDLCRILYINWDIDSQKHERDEKHGAIMALKEPLQKHDRRVESTVGGPEYCYFVRGRWPDDPV